MPLAQGNAFMIQLLGHSLKIYQFLNFNRVQKVTLIHSKHLRSLKIIEVSTGKFLSCDNGTVIND